MKSLHQIPDEFPATRDNLLTAADMARLREAIRNTPLQPFQQDWYNRYVGGNPTYFYEPMRLNGRDDLDFQVRNVEDVIRRLTHQRTALLMANLPLDDYALKVTRTEAYALQRTGYVREGDVGTFYGIRLVVAE